MPFPSSRSAGCLLACALVLVLASVLAGCNQPSELPDTQIAGLMIDADLDEISGIAASRREDGVLWAIDDSGKPANLYAISHRGNRLATFKIEGVKKTDWEDIASFELDGKAYLLIADTGDNGGIRKTLSLHVVEEPQDIEAGGSLKPAWSIQFRWPDGARDCEAIAVDAQRNEILLITKKRQPPQLYTLQLRADDRKKAPKTLTARLAGTLAGVPQAEANERRDNPSMARLRSQVTAAGINPQRDAIAVLTYANLLVYTRQGDDTWAQTVARPPLVVRMMLLPQPEAVTFSRGGKGIYATGEFSPAPILYLPDRR